MITGVIDSQTRGYSHMGWIAQVGEQITIIIIIIYEYLFTG